MNNNAVLVLPSVLDARIILPKEYQIINSCNHNIVYRDHSTTATIANPPSTNALSIPTQPSISIDFDASDAFTI